MASGWNLWMWLECIGVVIGCCCKEVYIYMYRVPKLPRVRYIPRDVSRKLQLTLCAKMVS